LFLCWLLMPLIERYQAYAALQSDHSDLVDC